MADTEDELREEAWLRRRALRRTVCVCGPDLPGCCPGPANCPYSGYDDDTEDDDGDAS